MFGSKLLEPMVAKKRPVGGYWDDEEEDDSFIDNGDLGDDMGGVVDSGDWRREIRRLTKYNPSAFRDEGLDDR